MTAHHVLGAGRQVRDGDIVLHPVALAVHLPLVLDRLAKHVTSFAKMMTKRTGDQELAIWLERVDADDQPELHTFLAGDKPQDRSDRDLTVYLRGLYGIERHGPSLVGT